jgi:membrane-bound lytic murein transglycosylase D
MTLDEPSEKFEQPTGETPAAKTEQSPITDATLDAVRKVESNDGKYLKSPAGAEGPYQFMPATAKSYNLKDPYDETDSRRAARELLEDELDALKDEKLAFAAYNLGRTRLNKAIEKAGSREWEVVKNYVPEETRNYVSKILEARGKILKA